ncbi:hypothetical protein DFH27DRAFT_536104 [Peziza echinospora]|nr:hypothetical protein DFH27DRAFT_536104 [Peziza echinospora]
MIQLSKYLFTLSYGSERWDEFGFGEEAVNSRGREESLNSRLYQIYVSICWLFFCPFIFAFFFLFSLFICYRGIYFVFCVSALCLPASCRYYLGKGLGLST